jgi:hypothetical protein
MSKSLVLFNGIDANGRESLWETDGTAAGTWEVSVPPVALDPVYITAFENEALFGFSLSVSDGTSAGTTQVSVAAYPAVVTRINRAPLDFLFCPDDRHVHALGRRRPQCP